MVIYRFYLSGNFMWPRDRRSSLPSVVETRLVQVQIWPILIFNERSRIHMIILLQIVAIQFRRLLLKYFVLQSAAK